MRIDEESFFGVHIPAVKQFGIKADTMSGGNAVSAILPFSEAHSNAHGTMSGAAIMALLDFSMAASVRAHAPLSYLVLTLDLSVKFLGPGKTDLYADCHCERRGRSVCFANGTIFDAAGEKIATASGIFKLVTL